MGLVTEHIRKLVLPDPGDVQFVVVGPPVMMKFAAAEVRSGRVPEKNIWVSFERLDVRGPVSAGHCKIDSTYICLDGPVLNYAKASRLIDREVNAMSPRPQQESHEERTITKMRNSTAVRIRVPGGHLGSEEMRIIADIAEKFGDGSPHHHTTGLRSRISPSNACPR